MESWRDAVQSHDKSICLNGNILCDLALHFATLPTFIGLRRATTANFFFFSALGKVCRGALAMGHWNGLAVVFTGDGCRQWYRECKKKTQPNELNA